MRITSLAWNDVWWPHLDSDIDQCVKHCYPCQSSRNSPAKAPQHPWQWPTEPWQRIHLDYAGPIEGRMILIVTDAHTKWIDADVTQTATSHITTERLCQCFTTHGLPRMTVTDNGTCFSSSKFTCLNGSEVCESKPSSFKWTLRTFHEFHQVWSQLDTRWKPSEQTITFAFRSPHHSPHYNGGDTGV